MRETRPSGSMRGRHQTVIGHVPLIPVVSPYSTKAHPRVEYRVAPAERSGLPDAAVDLVTLALAAHWFDLPRFYAEVRRVGRPRTAIALISSGFCMSTGSPM